MSFNVTMGTALVLTGSAMKTKIVMMAVMKSIVVSSYLYLTAAALS